jgi:macrolide transport system ATP-binding/permease protein
MINLRNVSFEYALATGGDESPQGVFRALDGVDLSIGRGEFVAVVGASGSGKTTLMNVVGLMATPTSGEVDLAGVSTRGLDADHLAALRNRSLGFIFQHFNLLARLTALENVLLPAQYVEDGRVDLRELEVRARSLLVEFGLAGHEDKPPALLSGGQKQRVAICRALLLEPDVILADEPTGALDSANTARVLDLLEHLNARGKTIVIITHDPQVAARARRVVRIHDGRIVSDELTTRGRAEGEVEVNASSSSLSASSRPSSSKRSWVAAALRFTAFRQAFANLAVNPVRSLLTVFGLAIGVSAIIIMLTLTGEASQAFRRFFDTKGGRSAWIGFDGREADRLGTGRWRGLHRDVEVPALSRFFARHGRIDPHTEESDCRFRSLMRTASGEVKGVSDLAQFRDAEMRLTKGRWFAPAEVAERVEKVVILGSGAASALFPERSDAALGNPNFPLGEILSVRGGCPLDLTLTVVGVLEEQDSSFDDSINNAVWAPTLTLRRGGISSYTRSVVVVPREGVSPTWLAENVKTYLRAHTGDRYPFRAFIPEQQIARVNLMLNVLGALTVVVGGLCTIIGGIGVMNIMLVNIAERVREIGVRKALGAKGFRIRNQFIVESTTLCLAAGLVGVAAGVLVSNAAVFAAARLAPRYLEAGFAWDPVAVFVALASSVAAGFGFGMLPARRAAAMDVVEALRQE